MTMMSNLLIKENFDEFNLDYEKNNTITPTKENKQNTLNKNYYNKKYNQYLNQDNNFIENIDDTDYYVQNNEVKYKIFEDISSISKNDESIELILNIPIENNIISINKIKLSNKLNKFIKNIYLNIDNKIIIKKEEIFESNETLSKIIENKNNIIKYLMDKNINLHIILEKNALNYIINKNIFVNYSYAIFKNKLKLKFN